MKYIIRGLIRFLFNLIAGVEVRGYENLPKDSSFVIATNHLGFVDVPIAFYALDRWDMFVLIAEKWGKIDVAHIKTPQVSKDKILAWPGE